MDGSGQPSADGGSVKKGKGKSRPTSKRRSRRQKVKKTYAKAREDAQLTGVIPTTPEGAVRPERVDPATQRDTALPELVRQALAEGWATPDSAKAKVVADLLSPFYDPDTDPRLLVRLARTLLLLDRTQWERDQPEEAGKARDGGATVVNVQNIEAAAAIRAMIERGDLGIIEESQPPDRPSAPGSVPDRPTRTEASARGFA